MNERPPLTALIAVTAAFAAVALWAPVAHAGRAPTQQAISGNDIEAKSAQEDQAALQFYRTSLNKLAVLCKQKENTAEEPIFLFRIAEAQYKVAALSFRLAHSTKAAREGHADMSQYHSTLEQLAKLASKIATKYPRHPNIARAIYLRAQAFKELEKDQEAIRDFRYLIDNFPQNEDMIPAQLAIYDLFTKTKDFKTAIMYLKRYQVPKTENYFPVSLDHLAFACFSMNDIPEALKYLEQELAVFPPQDTAMGTGGYSEREKILTNAALFYYTGFDAKMPQYTIAGTIPYFRHLTPGPIMAKMIGHFSNLLRAKGRDDDLETFRKVVMGSGFGPSEVTEVLNASIETSLNKRRMDRLKEATDQLSAMFSKMTPEQRKAGKNEKTQKLLAEAAANLNQSFLKVKDVPSEAAKITPVLISIYTLMLKVTESDSARQKIEFNMAEIFFGLKRYEAAALHYRWIAELRTPPDKEGQKLQLLARFKSLTSRYEALSEQKIFPKELSPKPFKGIPETAIPKEATQWIGWIDQYEKTPHTEPADAFEFEASRLLYSSGKVEDAVLRLRGLIKNYPKSTYVISSSSLILDTYVASERWEDANQLATEFLKTADPAKPEYRNKLIGVAGDSYFKTVEVLYKNKAYNDALTRAENFLKLYPTNRLRQSCLALAGDSALALKDKKRALTYFTPLMKETGVSAETQGTALLTTASVAEEKYDFEGAATTYRKYLALPPKSLSLDTTELKNLRIKVLEFSWLSGQSPLLKASLNTPGMCSPEISDHCEKYTALLGLMDPARTSDHTITNRAWDRAHKTSGPERAVWAALALENYRGVSFNNRIQLLDIISTSWDKLDPLARFALLPVLNVSIPGSLHQAAAEIRSMSKLQLDKAALDKRTNLIQKLEAGIGKVVDMPWQRLRAGALSQLADLYASFSKDLAALPAPQGLAGDDLKMYNQTVAELRAPFDKKVDDLRKQALEAATDGTIEADTYNQIAQVRDAEHPPAADQPKPLYSGVKPPLLGTELLEAMHAPAPFTLLVSNAVKASNWGLLAFLIQDAKEKTTLDESQLSAARGLSLTLAGAQAESLGELKASLEKIEKPARLEMMAALAVAYSAVRAKDKAKTAIEEFISASSESFRKTSLRPDFARELAEGAPLAGATLSEGTLQELTELGSHPRAPASQGKDK